MEDIIKFAELAQTVSIRYLVNHAIEGVKRLDEGRESNLIKAMNEAPVRAFDKDERLDAGRRRLRIHLNSIVEALYKVDKALGGGEDF